MHITLLSDFLKMNFLIRLEESRKEDKIKKHEGKYIHKSNKLSFDNEEENNACPWYNFARRL